MVEKETTIVIRNDTRERLKMLGHKGQTYGQLINQLLNLKSDKMDPLDRSVESETKQVHK